MNLFFERNSQKKKSNNIFQTFAIALQYLILQERQESIQLSRLF